MNRKSLLILILGLLLIFITLSIGFAGWPIKKTPIIEGRVIDATTGEPIRNAYVMSGLYRSTFNLVDRNYGGFGLEEVITGEDGKFRIKSRTTWEITGFLRRFNGMGMTIYHPLYEKKGSDTEDLLNWSGENYEKLVKMKDKDDIVHIDVFLFSLEEKYLKEVEKIKVETINEDEKKKKIGELSYKFEASPTIFENGGYWRKLDKNKIEYRLEDVFEVWENIALSFDQYYGSNYKMRDVKESEGKIRKVLGK